MTHHGLGIAVEGSRIILDPSGQRAIPFTPDSAIRLAEALEWCCSQALPDKGPLGLAVSSWKLGLSTNERGHIVLRLVPPEVPALGEDLRFPSLRQVTALVLARQLRKRVVELEDNE